mmetsp:Transcript_125490/g.187409  ORF Transcript_125490/g.187409 Transcript_125490/m.187409 type:complete len:81 (+) Transcript_125490:644-886(+)
MEEILKKNQNSKFSITIPEKYVKECAKGNKKCEDKIKDFEKNKNSITNIFLGLGAKDNHYYDISKIPDAIRKAKEALDKK